MTDPTPRDGLLADDARLADTPDRTDAPPGRLLALSPLDPEDAPPGRLYNAPSVTDPLLEQPYRYGYFQLLRLLAARRPERPLPGAGRAPQDEPAAIHPDPTPVFPTADIKQVEVREAPGAVPFDVTVTFDGLYGVDAAVPAGLVSRIATDPAGTRPLRDFLDLFGHRFYGALWQAWSRSRPEVLREDGQDTHRRRLFALAGLGTPGASAPDPALLPLAGRLGTWGRGPEGLEALVQHQFGVGAQVEEFAERRVTLPSRPGLGAARLGHDAVVGQTVVDQTGQFRLALGPMSRARYDDLLPGAPGAARLARLVAAYVPDPLGYDVDLLMQPDDALPARLGDPDTARLGRSARLGRAPQAVRRRVHYA